MPLTSSPISNIVEPNLPAESTQFESVTVPESSPITYAAGANGLDSAANMQALVNGYNELLSVAVQTSQRMNAVIAALNDRHVTKDIG